MKHGKACIALILALILIGTSSADFDSAKKHIEDQIAEKISMGLREGNEPFFIGDDNDIVGVLLIHGFTASPWEVRELAEYISIKNISVYGPLLAGHGTSAEDLKKIKWEEWYRSVNETYTAMAEMYECVYVGGMSTGSSLALMLAEEHEVCGIIAIGTPIYFQDWKIRLAWLAKYFLPFTTRELSDEIKPYYYEQRPTAAVAELFELTGKVKKLLPEIREPTIIIQSLQDKTIKPKSADYIMREIGSQKKVFIWFEEGEHVIIKDKQRDEVFKLIDNFLEDDIRSRQ